MKNFKSIIISAVGTALGAGITWLCGKLLGDEDTLYYFLLSLIVTIPLILIIWGIYLNHSWKEKHPDFLNDTSMNVGKLTWTWQWKQNDKGIWQLVNLRPLCPTCKNILSVALYREGYHCVNGHSCTINNYTDTRNQIIYQIRLSYPRLAHLIDGSNG